MLPITNYRQLSNFAFACVRILKCNGYIPIKMIQVDNYKCLLVHAEENKIILTSELLDSIDSKNTESIDTSSFKQHSFKNFIPIEQSIIDVLNDPHYNNEIIENGLNVKIYKKDDEHKAAILIIPNILINLSANYIEDNNKLEKKNPTFFKSKINEKKQLMNSLNIICNLDNQTQKNSPNCIIL